MLILFGFIGALKIPETCQCYHVIRQALSLGSWIKRLLTRMSREASMFIPHILLPFSWLILPKFADLEDIA